MKCSRLLEPSTNWHSINSCPIAPSQTTRAPSIDAPLFCPYTRHLCRWIHHSPLGSCYPSFGARDLCLEPRDCGEFGAPVLPLCLLDIATLRSSRLAVPIGPLVSYAIPRLTAPCDSQLRTAKGFAALSFLFVVLIIPAQLLAARESQTVSFSRLTCRTSLCCLMLKY